MASSGVDALQTPAKSSRKSLSPLIKLALLPKCPLEASKTFLKSRYFIQLTLTISMRLKVSEMIRASQVVGHRTLTSYPALKFHQRSKPLFLLANPRSLPLTIARAASREVLLMTHPLCLRIKAACILRNRTSLEVDQWVETVTSNLPAASKSRPRQVLQQNSPVCPSSSKL